MLNLKSDVGALGPRYSRMSTDNFCSRKGSYSIHTFPRLLFPLHLTGDLGNLSSVQLSGDDTQRTVTHQAEVWLNFPGVGKALWPQSPRNLLHCSSPTLTGFNVDAFLCSRIGPSGEQRALRFS